MQPLLARALRPLVFAAATAPLLAQATPTHPNLVYGSLAGHPLALDLYLPSTGSAPYPLVIWIHGGAWTSGSRYPIPGGAEGLLARGIAVASVDYRLTSEIGQYGSFPVTFPAQIEDVKGAVRWLRANAATYGLDAARFGCWGSSAGGHLSALLATSGGVAELEGATGGNLGFSSAVQAAADYFGPIDILQMNPDVTTPPGSTIDHDAPNSPESVLIGFDDPGQGLGVLRAHVGDPTPPYPFYELLATQVNPITWVDAGDPPMFLAHGTDDTLVAIHQSVRLADALRAAGVPYAYDQAIGFGHGLGGPHDTAVQLFFEQQLRGTQVVQGFCSADAASAACPCGNAGDAGHGCASSLAGNNGGLLLAGGGSASASMTLFALGLPANALAVLIQGDAEVAPVFFGDGLRCVGGQLLRLATRPAFGGSFRFPDPGLGDPSIQARCAALGAPIAPGSPRGYFLYHRDAAPAFCPAPQGGTFNATNAVRIVWP